jgi:hypothetical protein
MGAGKAFICLHQKMRLRQVSDILEAAKASIVLVDAAGLMTGALGDSYAHRESLYNRESTIHHPSGKDALWAVLQRLSR